MIRKKRRPFVIKYIIIAIIIFGASVLISIWTRILLMADYRFFSFTEEQAGLVTGMIEGAVGAIAAGFVLYELDLNAGVEARQNDIEEAQFLLEYNQAFIQDEKMCEIEHRLEQWMEGTLERGTLVNDGNCQRFINYLVYLEGLAPLIFRDILKLEHIDDLMAYRFFLALNNRELQEDQLFRYPEYYRGCFKLYAIWKSYRTKNGHPTPLSEYALDLWPEFEKYSESLVTVRELRSASDRKRAAGLIYDTDPYIYPAAFGSRRRAVRTLPGFMRKDCLFHEDNIYAAELNGKVVGIALLVDTASRIAAPSMDRGYPPKGFADAQKRYFSTIADTVSSIHSSAHLVCLCVERGHRGERIGEILLKRVIRECQDRGLSAVTLDVLAENSVAIRLYENYGFKQESVEQGYAYHMEAPRCLRMVLRFSWDIANV